jgi:hypothetical protein
MLWRHFRREETHCELFVSVKALIQAAQNFFDRYNKIPQQILSIVGVHPKRFLCLYLAFDFFVKFFMELSLVPHRLASENRH